jgi:hypothetical protein
MSKWPKSIGVFVLVLATASVALANGHAYRKLPSVQKDFTKAIGCKWTVTSAGADCETAPFYVGNFTIKTRRGAVVAVEFTDIVEDYAKKKDYSGDVVEHVAKIVHVLEPDWRGGRTLIKRSVSRVKSGPSWSKRSIKTDWGKIGFQSADPNGIDSRYVDVVITWR